MKKIILSISLWLAATAAFATTQAQDDEDKPPLVFLYGDEAESRDHSDTYQDFYWLYSDGSTQADFSIDDQLWWYSEHIWILGLGGAGTTSSGETEYSWDSFGDESVDDDQKSVWNFDLDGTGAGGGNEIYYAYGTATSTNSDSLDILPDIGNEHCDVTDGYPPPAYWPGGSAPGLQIQGHATEIYQRTAQTMWHVQTGGKAVPGRLNLWQFTGSAAQLLNLRAQPPFTYASTQPIPPTQVALGGLGNLQADGTLWVTLPDGIEEDVTPSVPGLNFYEFSVGGGKYDLSISAGGIILSNDVVATAAKFCVGQNISLSPAWDPVRPPIQSAYNIQWLLPGEFVNTNLPPLDSDGSTEYIYDPQWLNIENTHAWWYNGQYAPQPSAAGFVEDLSFANGQTVTVHANGLFEMHRPRLVNYTLSSGPSTGTIVHNHYRGTTPSDMLEYDSAQYSVDVDMNSEFGSGGIVRVTQLLGGYKTNSAGTGYNTYGTNELDASDPYNNITAPVIAGNPAGSEITFYDAPDIGCYYHTEQNQYFTDYIRFRPDGGIPVTLGTLTWYVVDSSDLDVGNNDYTPIIPPLILVPAYDMPTGTGYVGSPSASDNFPYWYHTIAP